MTENRFIIAICGDGKLGIRDLTTLNEYTSERQVADYMNRITDENEQLRLQLNLCSDQRNEFHRGVRENANRVGKLKKENEQLKSTIKEGTELLSDELEQCRAVIDNRWSEYLKKKELIE